jgi:hypothetical protein
LVYSGIRGRVSPAADPSVAGVAGIAVTLDGAHTGERPTQGVGRSAVATIRCGGRSGEFHGATYGTGGYGGVAAGGGAQ